MKIDFLARYSDVNQLTDIPNKAQTGDGSFDRHLESSLSNQLKSNDFLPSKTQIGSLRRPIRDDLMGRYNFTEPELIPPLTERSTEPYQGVDRASTGVKSPSIIDARRIQKGPGGVSLPNDARINRFKGIVDRAGERHGVDPTLSLAVASAESALNPRAISSDGHRSKGLFQLLDSTGKHLHQKNEKQGPYNPFDPELNTDLGVSYLRYLHDIFATKTELPNKLQTHAAANSSSLEKLAVAAFNAGEGRVASAQRNTERAGKDPTRYEDVAGYLPDITRDYVDRVMKIRDQFSQDNDGGLEP